MAPDPVHNALGEEWVFGRCQPLGKHDATIGRLVELRTEIRRELARTWRETTFSRDALRAALGDAAAVAAAERENDLESVLVATVEAAEAAGVRK